MKKTIETKFDIGDSVYIADYYYEFYANKNPYIITDVLIDINGKRTKISYDVEQGDFMYRIPEAWAFRTYDQCREWCDERNTKTVKL